ncbi:MAG: N-acyl-D-glutamate deacylase [Peptococcaceae bacterium]|jgi:N-acyl-D-amino-acid deacylase|uniref:Amidohydrolase family protein n=1 Tax=Thermanaerosceptrum fracticalcis TaxID=1712410 RepID=A0A7G6E3E4_THEFR|nr:amidohydrolase family protein [Thermanaerosceptrum fracticalcis]MBZ4654164.1 N-acyl-D-glutamate deacylase [Peptococcaceae bacterium]QNB46598.1 amidohydrolase family protein [Thermanaerosceptrum fracticalcis]
MKEMTRRQFLLGLGAVAAATLLTMGWDTHEAIPQEGALSSASPQPIDCDWIIDHVRIVDGTGSPAFMGKVAVKGDKIVAVGDFMSSPGTKTIDGKNYALAPGFIDIHTHTESYFYSGESMAAFLSQGVTTQVGGNCGRSPRDIAGFLKSSQGRSMNYGLLIGYRTLLELVQGVPRAGRVTPAELGQMQEHLHKGLSAGALGLSIGLEYWPQNFATTHDLIILCEVVKEHGGFYATHIRSEYDKVLQAVEETVEIGLKSGVAVQYSHIKAGYPQNWPKFARVLDMLAEANKSGLDMRADVYPYTFSGNDIGTKPLRHSISVENLEAALIHPHVFYASDSGIYTGGRATHPRAYGTYPRFLGHFVREKGLLPLEKAVAKMTHEPARRLKLQDRGLIRPGYKADLVLFDEQRVMDKATYEKPVAFSEGIEKVWVNGVLAWNEQKVTGSTSGQFLKLTS